MRSREELREIFLKVAAMYGYLRDPAKSMAASFKPVTSISKLKSQIKPPKIPTFKTPKIPKVPEVT